MKQVFLDIPDEKYAFFMELVNNLGFVESREYVIPDEQMEMVAAREERTNRNPERLLDWEAVKDDFELD